MFRLVKRHKRLLVVDDGDELVYSAPNFVRVNSRDDYQTLVDAFNAAGEFDGDAVTRFECRFRTNKLVFPCGLGCHE